MTPVIASLLRRAADSRPSAPSSGDDELTAARDARLLSPGYRRTIATGLRRLVDLAEKQATLAHVPLRRQAIRESSDELLSLANEVEYEAEIRARGVILASRLVDDASSPAYAADSEPGDLIRAVKQARTALLLG